MGRIVTKDQEKAPEAEEISQSLQLILAPGQVTELRALDVSTQTHRYPHTVSGYFDYDHIPQMAQAAAWLSPYAKAVYFIPNPVNPALLARAANRVRAVGQRDPLTSDRDILARRYLLIDADPIRSAGISSTDVEHEAAIARIRKIQAFLKDRGWPDGILADSGNGAHLLYRVDLPVEDSALLQRCLKALAFRFDDEIVQIDQTTFNPSRIWKLYGTLARKGDDTPLRPHRMAQLLGGN